MSKISEAWSAKNLRISISRDFDWQLGLSIALAIAGTVTAFENCALAQITPDSTLGVESSIVTPNANVRGIPAELIEGGATRGVNLFHSFTDFNVGNGQRVYFANPAGIENILSRVTGNNLSNILGTLGVDGGASLFLLNPNGIIFGENARLDIAGSFVASTANSVVFENGTRFSATNPEAPPLLTINVTPGLQYGTNQPNATIANAGNLVVGQDLTLSAGNLDLQGQLVAGGDLTLFAMDTVRVRDSVVSPFIASANGNLLVQGNQAVDIFALNHPNSGLFSGGNMVLRSASRVGGDAHYWSGGSFRIEKLDGSLGDLYSPYDPIIRSLGDVSFFAYGGSSLHILAGGAVNIGTAIIVSPETGAVGVDYLQETVTLSNGRQININGSLQPTLDIRAGVDPAFIGVPGVTGVGFLPPDIFSGLTPPTTVPTSANIAIANIGIFAPNGQVLITNQYQPNTSVPGGDITITGTGLFGRGISTGRVSGNAGSVILDSRNNIALTNSSIDTSSSTGNARDITLLANNTVSLNNSTVFSRASGAGAAGNTNIQARQLLVTNGAQVNVSTLGDGQGGNLIINASQAVQLIGRSADGTSASALVAGTAGNGNGGKLEITTSNLLVKDGAIMTVSAAGDGNAGNLMINASDSVQLIGTSTNGQSPSVLGAISVGKGDGGNIEITTPVLLVQDGAGMNVSSLGEGKGGNLIINAFDVVQLSGTSVNGTPTTLAAATVGKGDGGNIEITTGELLVKDGAIVSLSNLGLGEGKGGNLIINASQEVQLSGTSADGQSASALGATTFGNQDGGNIEITTPVLLVKDGAGMDVSTLGEGKGGNLIINASQGVQLSGTSADGKIASALGASAFGKGDGGNVQITTFELLVKDGAAINLSTAGEGKGGRLIINASQGVQLIGTSADGQFRSALASGSVGKGDGGNVEITTGELLVKDGAVVTVSTENQGKGGNLIVNASQGVQVIGTSVDGQLRSGLAAATLGKGDGGNIEITTPGLLVKDGAEVSVSTQGERKGGSLIVNASQGVQVTGTSADGGIRSSLDASTSGTGNGGNVEITTPGLLVTDGAQVTASTTGEGKGGSLIVNASDFVQLMGTSANGQFSSSLDASTSGTGNGGDVEFTTRQLLVTDGAQVTASTTGEGRGGSLIVNASEEVQLRGTGGLFVDATAGGTAGNLTVTTRDISVRDGAQVTVSSPQGQAGNLNITANSLTLNQGTISAETAKSDAAEGGANITLSNLDFLRMDNESLISASALGNANGGNVTIDSTLIVATPPTGPEGSDIIANAEQGNGGQVNITTQGLFGIEFRPQRTPKNDITVSSTFGLSGEFTLNSPGVDPSRGLAELPINITDASELIDRRCTPGSDARQSSFTITGRGGLPPSPNNPLTNNEVQVDWATLEDKPETPDREPTNTKPTSSKPQQLVEAQGWMIDENGQITLTAQAAKVTPQGEWLSPLECHPLPN